MAYTETTLRLYHWLERNFHRSEYLYTIHTNYSAEFGTFTIQWMKSDTPRQNSSNSEVASYRTNDGTSIRSWTCHDDSAATHPTRPPIGWITDPSPGVKNGYRVKCSMNAQVTNARIITGIDVRRLSTVAIGFYWTPEYTEQLDGPQRPTAGSQNKKKVTGVSPDHT